VGIVLPALSTSVALGARLCVLCFGIGARS
jgi:hypothetical protein